MLSLATKGASLLLVKKESTLAFSRPFPSCLIMQIRPPVSAGCTLGLKAHFPITGKKLPRQASLQPTSRMRIDCRCYCYHHLFAETRSCPAVQTGLQLALILLPPPHKIGVTGVHGYAISENRFCTRNVWSASSSPFLLHILVHFLFVRSSPFTHFLDCVRLLLSPWLCDFCLCLSLQPQSPTLT